MPSLPEYRHVGGLVRRVEVLRKVETHQHRRTDCDVGIAGEISIYLQGIAEHREKILEAGVKCRILEHPVAQADSDEIAHYQLLG